jgi:hypothetical protein
MSANEALNALSTTHASNSPAGGDNIGTTLDDELRSNKGNIASAARWEVTATITAASTIPVTAMHKLVPCDGSAGGTVTLTLPTVANAGNGFDVDFIKIGAVNKVIIDGNGAEAVDGGTGITLSAIYGRARLVCNGSKWFSQTPDKSPMTTAGDTVYGGTDGLPTRLAKGGAFQSLHMNAGATAPEWNVGIHRQIAFPSAASEVVFTPVIEDGLYRLTWRLSKNAGGNTNIGLSTSDDAGSNYNNVSGDATTVYWYEVLAGSFVPSGDSTTTLGAPLDYGAGGGASANEGISGFCTVAINVEKTHVQVSVISQGHNSAGNMVNMRSTTHLSAHATGINRIRIAPGANDMTGVILLEEIPLS